MTQIHLEWLQSDAQDEMPPAPSVPSPSEPSDPHLAGSESEDGAAALYLVYRAAEVLLATQDRASASETRANTVAGLTMEQLKLAEQRLYDADAEREELESKLNEANTRIREYEVALSDAEARNADAEAKLKALERRAIEAETRANATRAALRRIEEAIRTHLLAGEYSNKLKAAA